MRNWPMRTPNFWQKAGGLAALLTPVSRLYHAGHMLRWKLSRAEDAGVPVICVGNLVAGGAGKSPVVMALVRLFRHMGQEPHILCRGYKGSFRGPVMVNLSVHTEMQVGDEAMMMAHVAPTWVARNRLAGARKAREHGARVIIMDDGMQYPRLKKRLNLCVIDGGYGFGNGRLLPAGPLRETMAQAIPRLDGCILIGKDMYGVTAMVPPRMPLIRAHYVPDPTVLARLKGAKLLAFCGIGRPEKFFETLLTHGLKLEGTRSFPDHHRFGADEIAEIRHEAEMLGLTPVTTEKDWMRLSENQRQGIAMLPVTLSLEPEEKLTGLLRHALAP